MGWHLDGTKQTDRQLCAHVELSQHDESLSHAVPHCELKGLHIQYVASYPKRGIGIA